MRRLLVMGILMVTGCGGTVASTTNSTGPPATLVPPSQTTTSDAPTDPTSTTAGQPSTTDATQDSTQPDVTPVITFDERTLTFVRELRVPLWASADPEVPLAYRVVPDADAVGDENCLIDGTDFVFVTEPNPPPAPARCAVEVSAPGTEAEPVTRIVEVGFADWAVAVAPIDTVVYSATDGTVDITVFEDSGSAYGISVDWFCGGEGDIESASPSPSDPGTTEYSFALTLADPGVVGSYTCRIDARAEPQDHYGGKGDDQVEFEVVP